MSEVVLISSGDKYKSNQKVNFIVGNGLIGDTYIPDLDGNVIAFNPIGIRFGAKDDRILLGITGENGEFTDKQFQAIIDTLLIIKKYLGMPKIFRYEDLYENCPENKKTISLDALKKIQHYTQILWKKEE